MATRKKRWISSSRQWGKSITLKSWSRNGSKNALRLLNLTNMTIKNNKVTLFRTKG
jgi:hypothetical protein